MELKETISFTIVVYFMKKRPHVFNLGKYWSRFFDIGQRDIAENIPLQYKTDLFIHILFINVNYEIKLTYNLFMSL